jgi:hypothetical protein
MSIEISPIPHRGVGFCVFDAMRLDLFGQAFWAKRAKPID